jgi:hypothetical protein
MKQTVDREKEKMRVKERERKREIGKKYSAVFRLFCKFRTFI